jgi:hypothetical protein
MYDAASCFEGWNALSSFGARISLVSVVVMVMAFAA